MWWLIACANDCPSDYTTGDEETVSTTLGPMVRRVEEAGVCGPAFLDAADLDADGTEEILVSVFGNFEGFSVPNGGVRAIQGDRREWLVSPELGLKWPNGASPKDVDGDGDLDLVVGFGFLTCQLDPYTAPCGHLAWFENDGAWTEHTLVTDVDGFYHHAELVDLDADGRLDLVTAVESQATPMGHAAGSTVQWLPGVQGGFGPVQDLSDGLGGIPTVADVDQDGDLDVVAARYFEALGQGDQTGFAWLENADGDWLEHAIDPTSGPGIQMSAFEDGFLGANHVTDDPFLALYAPGEDPASTWEREILAEGFRVTRDDPGVGAPGVFDVGDIDGDGDLDVLLSGDGDPSIYLVLQGDDGWTTHELQDGMGQGGVAIADLDGDGRNELIASSWEENVVLSWRMP